MRKFGCFDIFSLAKFNDISMSIVSGKLAKPLLNRKSLSRKVSTTILYFCQMSSIYSFEGAGEDT